MTLLEFVYELRKHVPAGAWSLIADRYIRAAQSEDGPYHCPITALCWWRDGKFYSLWDLPPAVEFLGLSRPDYLSIVNAADGGSKIMPHLREVLLDATVNKR